MSLERIADRLRFVPALHLISLLYYGIVSWRFPGAVGRQLKALLCGVAAMLPWSLVAIFIPQDATLDNAIVFFGALYCVILCMLSMIRSGVMQQIALRK